MANNSAHMRWLTGHALQRTAGRSVSGLRHSERRCARPLRLGTKRSEVFQLRRALALPETNRRTRRTIREAPIGRNVPPIKMRFSTCAMRLVLYQRLKNSRAAGRRAKFRDGIGFLCEGLAGGGKGGAPTRDREDVSTRRNSMTRP